jgi:hypothetical protein
VPVAKNAIMRVLYSLSAAGIYCNCELVGGANDVLDEYLATPVVIRRSSMYPANGWGLPEGGPRPKFIPLTGNIYVEVTPLNCPLIYSDSVLLIPSIEPKTVFVLIS